MRTPVHASLLSTLLLAVLAWPSASFALVACDAEAVREVAGFCIRGVQCEVYVDITCDTSCGTECVYDFGLTDVLFVLGIWRSTGPPMHFIANRMVLRGLKPVRSKVPGIETAEGGFVSFTFVDSLDIARPVFVPGGTIEFRQGTYVGQGTSNVPTAKLDVSSYVAGGTIRFKQGVFLDLTLLARGLGPTAPGGSVIIETRNPSELNLPGENGHRIDVSGASGGTLLAGAIDGGGHLLAHGRRGAGGWIELDGRGRSGSSIVMGPDCTPPIRHRIRVDGRRGPGGTFIAREDPDEGVSICQRIDASGKGAGGTVLLEAGGVTIGRHIRAKGRGGPGGTVSITGLTGGVFVKDRIDVRGASGGVVELKSNALVRSQGQIYVDARTKGQAGGQIYLGEIDDPPSGRATVEIHARLSAKSRGDGGSVTLRGCRVHEGFSPLTREGNSFEVRVKSENPLVPAQILFQSRKTLELPPEVLAVGPATSIRAEYGRSFTPADTADPDPQVVQYPNPACDCTMTLAECMTPP